MDSVRLDIALAQLYPALSRATIQRQIVAGKATVNEVTIKSSACLVKPTDKLYLEPLPTYDFSAEIEWFSSHNVIFENDKVIVVNKPAGMLTHAKGVVSQEFTVADFVRTRFNKGELDNSNNRLGIVHRLDRATSGVLICAKDIATQSFLSRQFADRKAHKVYLALVKKVPKELTATIDLPLARYPKKPATFRVDAKGKAAITKYEVKSVYDDGTALLELRPQTGRTHQLRVHLAYIGSPIVGDPIYGDCSECSTRLMLHAAELEITVPTQLGNERKTFRAPLPSDFSKILEDKHGTVK